MQNQTSNLPYIFSISNDSDSPPKGSRMVLQGSWCCIQPDSRRVHIKSGGYFCPTSSPSAKNFLFLLCLGCGDLATVLCQNFNLLPNNEWKTDHISFLWSFIWWWCYTLNLRGKIPLKRQDELRSVSHDIIYPEWRTSVIIRLLMIQQIFVLQLQKRDCIHQRTN